MDRERRAAHAEFLAGVRADIDREEALKQDVDDTSARVITAALAWAEATPRGPRLLDATLHDATALYRRAVAALDEYTQTNPDTTDDSPTD
jgi:hypothetical protein